MAEANRIMRIFPQIRISELKKDLEEKRRRFQDSSHALRETLRTNTNPLTLLKKHPRVAVGAVASSLTLWKVFGGLSGSKKRTAKNTEERSGMKGMENLIGLGRSWAFKIFLPLAFAALRVAAKSFLKKPRD